MKNAMKYR